MKEPYTVVLLRPEYLSQFTKVPYGQDTYVALVTAEDSLAAIKAAQAQVFDSDVADGLADDVDDLPPRERPKSLFAAESYELSMVFSGHVEPIMNGWGQSKDALRHLLAKLPPWTPDSPDNEPATPAP